MDGKRTRRRLRESLDDGTPQSLSSQPFGSLQKTQRFVQVRASTAGILFREVQCLSLDRVRFHMVSLVHVLDEVREARQTRSPAYRDPCATEKNDLATV